MCVNYKECGKFVDICSDCKIKVYCDNSCRNNYIEKNKIDHVCNVCTNTNCKSINAIETKNKSVIAKNKGDNNKKDILILNNNVKKLSENNLSIAPGKNMINNSRVNSIKFEDKKQQQFKRKEIKEIKDEDKNLLRLEKNGKENEGCSDVCLIM